MIPEKQRRDRRFKRLIKESTMPRFSATGCGSVGGAGGSQPAPAETVGDPD